MSEEPFNNNEEEQILTDENTKYLNTSAFTNEQVDKVYHPKSWFPSFSFGSKSNMNKIKNKFNADQKEERFQEVMKRRNASRSKLFQRPTGSTVSSLLSTATSKKLVPGIVYTNNPLHAMSKGGRRTRKLKKKKSKSRKHK